MKTVADYDKLLNRVNSLLDRLESLVPPAPTFTIDAAFRACRWTAHGLEGIPDFDRVEAAELLHIERQKNLILRNTRQFLDGAPANNALLWGARGTGKSSLIKSQLSAFSEKQLCIVEVPKSGTAQLFDIIRQLGVMQRKFIIYLDDLSFEANDDSYKALKACLEGSLQPQPQNLLIYATSNRRHLMPETMQDNLESKIVEGELHPGDNIEEKISLSDRFGLWLSFYPFTQDQYLAVVEQTLNSRQLSLCEETRRAAIQFATSRGSRSGRIAFQFAAYWSSLQD